MRCKSFTKNRGMERNSTEHAKGKKKVAEEITPRPLLLIDYRFKREG